MLFFYFVAFSTRGEVIAFLKCAWLIFRVWEIFGYILSKKLANWDFSSSSGEVSATLPFFMFN